MRSDSRSLSLSELCLPAASRPLGAFFLMLAGVGVLALSAQYAVPFYPVPMTMQTFAVLLIGVGYGGWAGVGTIAAYLAAGAAGLPVFAGGGGGIAALFGPSGGYLIGFLVAGVFMRWAARRGADNRFLTLLGALFIAGFLIYACGLPQLKLVLNLDWQKTLALGLYPFVLGDALKTVLAALMVYHGKNLLRAKQ